MANILRRQAFAARLLWVDNLEQPKKQTRDNAQIELVVEIAVVVVVVAVVADGVAVAAAAVGGAAAAVVVAVRVSVVDVEAFVVVVVAVVAAAESIVAHETIDPAQGAEGHHQGWDFENARVGRTCRRHWRIPYMKQLEDARRSAWLRMLGCAGVVVQTILEHQRQQWLH